LNIIKVPEGLGDVFCPKCNNYVPIAISDENVKCQFCGVLFKIIRIQKETKPI
jgi:hypothetical protein